MKFSKADEERKRRNNCDEEVGSPKDNERDLNERNENECS